MKLRLLLLVWLTVGGGVRPANAADVLQFLDGSALHGTLNSIDGAQGVRWQHPDVAKVIDFLPRNLHLVKLDQPRQLPTNALATCRFHFANGDDVLGHLIALDAETVTLETWFAGRLHAPRGALRSLTFLHAQRTTYYEGPTRIEDWKVGPTADVWRVQDGALVVSGFGFCGRDVKFPPKSRTEFDLTWSGPLNLIVSVYTDNTDRFDWSSSSYQFNIGSGYVTLMRGQGAAGMAYLGQVQVPQMVAKNKVRLTILVNQEQASLTLMADGVAVQTWRDAAGFSGKGTGLLFYSQRNGPTLRISDLRVSDWDGQLEVHTPLTTNIVTETTVKLANHDQLAGTVDTVSEGKISVTVGGGSKFAIPLARVTDIFFPEGATNQFTRRAGDWRAQFFGGDNLALAVQTWNHQTATAQSANFGPLTLKSEWVRQLEFNPGPAKSAATDVGFLETEPAVPLE